MFKRPRRRWLSTAWECVFIRPVCPKAVKQDYLEFCAESSTAQLLSEALKSKQSLKLHSEMSCAPPPFNACTLRGSLRRPRCGMPISICSTPLAAEPSVEWIPGPGPRGPGARLHKASHGPTGLAPYGTKTAPSWNPLTAASGGSKGGKGRATTPGMEEKCSASCEEEEDVRQALLQMQVHVFPSNPTFGKCLTQLGVQKAVQNCEFHSGSFWSYCSLHGLVRLAVLALAAATDPAPASLPSSPNHFLGETAGQASGRRGPGAREANAAKQVAGL